MTAILVHNETFRTEAEARRERASERAVRRIRWWNVWKVRQQPFNELRDGSLVLLLDSWPRGGRLSWLVRAQEVHTEVRQDKDSAVRAIASWAGWTPSQVNGNPYTADRPADAGVVIFWRAEPLARVDVPRPAQLALGRNGWGITDVQALSRLGVHLPGTALPAGVAPKAPTRASSAGTGGQGHRLDVEIKNAIEQRAVAVAKGWCRRNGWKAVRDVGAQRLGWDLEAVDGSGVRRLIEVKGTTGTSVSVEVTKHEVDSAIQHGSVYSLAVVQDIHVARGTLRASKGVVCAYNPWEPKRSELVEQQFRWKPSMSRPAVP